jgi:hypothetical protein
MANWTLSSLSRKLWWTNCVLLLSLLPLCHRNRTLKLLHHRLLDQAILIAWPLPPQTNCFLTFPWTSLWTLKT